MRIRISLQNKKDLHRLVRRLQSQYPSPGFDLKAPEIEPKDYAIDLVVSEHMINLLSEKTDNVSSYLTSQIYDYLDGRNTLTSVEVI